MSPAAPKLRRHTGGYYRIEGYRLFLVPPSGSKPGWSLKAFASCGPARSWLGENGLREASFSTRARALDMFIQTASASPPPAGMLKEEVPGLIRIQKGSYRSRCGRWQLTKAAGKGWNARRESSAPGRPALGFTGATLSTVALQIHHLEHSTHPRWFSASAADAPGE